jgi:ABC-type glutathione transport system ATPase component
MLLRLETPDAGEIRLDGVDVLAGEPRHASTAYRRRVQMVFQDPFASLNPVQSVLEHLETPLRRLLSLPAAEVRGRALSLMRDVGLEPADEIADRLPHSLSGGQRQRVAIARALASEPELLVADEPTSMLDVSIRTGVLELLSRLRRERGLSVLLITHDLASARTFADRIIVLFHGRIVESGPSRQLVATPSHPYTRSLIEALGSVRAAHGGSNPALAASRQASAMQADAVASDGATFPKTSPTTSER